MNVIGSLGPVPANSPGSTSGPWSSPLYGSEQGVWVEPQPAACESVGEKGSGGPGKRRMAGRKSPASTLSEAFCRPRAGQV